MIHLKRAPSRTKERFLDAGEVQINFAHVPSSGQPLVLLHGVASEWRSFLPLLPELAQQNTIYALDLRGHGKSGRVAGGYRLLDYAQDVTCFLRKQVGQPAIVYGHSLGALIGLAVAAQSPAHVSGLILGDPPLYHHNTTLEETIWHEPFVELFYLLSSFDSAQAMDDYMAQHYPKMEPQRRKGRAECLSCVDPDVVAMILDHRQLEGYEVDNVLRQIACPVLIFQGNPTLGAATRDEDIAFATGRLRNCRVVRMQEVGHGLPPESLRHELTDFVKSIQGEK